MTVGFVPDIDVVPSLDNRVGAGATTERPAVAAVVVQIKQVSPPAGQRLSHERLHEIDRVFFGPFFREKYGRGGDKALENDRIRYYGLIQPTNDEGELAGRRCVHEFDTMTGCTRGCHESRRTVGPTRWCRRKKQVS